MVALRRQAQVILATLLVANVGPEILLVEVHGIVIEGCILSRIRVDEYRIDRVGRVVRERECLEAGGQADPGQEDLWLAPG